MSQMSNLTPFYPPPPCHTPHQTPRTPREDELLRVTAHLKKVLRLGTERPVELLHHRRHYLPPVAALAPPVAAAMPPSGGAVLWRQQAPVAHRGLFDVNRSDGLVYGGAYGWPNRDDSYGRGRGGWAGEER